MYGISLGVINIDFFIVFELHVCQINNEDLLN